MVIAKRMSTELVYHCYRACRYDDHVFAFIGDEVCCTYFLRSSFEMKMLLCITFSFAIQFIATEREKCSVQDKQCHRFDR